MISLIESSFLRPPKLSVPTDDDLNQYGLTRDQFDEWKKNNPDGRMRKIDNVIYDPKFLIAMSAIGAMNGRYFSAANYLNRALPEEVERRNRYYINQDLAAARKHYDSKTAAAGK